MLSWRVITVIASILINSCRIRCDRYYHPSYLLDEMLDECYRMFDLIVRFYFGRSRLVGGYCVMGYGLFLIRYVKGVVHLYAICWGFFGSTLYSVFGVFVRVIVI